MVRVVFAQVAGPRTFVADPARARLDASVPATVTAELTGDSYTSATTVTITNHGPQPATDVTVLVEHLVSVTVQAAGPAGECRRLTDSAVLCLVGDIAAGEIATLAVSSRLGSRHVDSLGRPVSWPGRVEMRTGTLRYPYVTYLTRAG